MTLIHPFIAQAPRSHSGAISQIHWGKVGRSSRQTPRSAVVHLRSCGLKILVWFGKHRAKQVRPLARQLFQRK